MAEFFFNYGLFFLKTLTFVIAVIAIVTVIVSAAARRPSGGDKDGHIEILKYNERLDDMAEALSFSMLEPVEQKHALKDKKATEKAEKKAAKAAAKRAKKQRGSGETVLSEPTRKRVYVLDFDGDIRASDVEKLRREITAVLTTATSDDEVVVLSLIHI